MNRKGDKSLIVGLDIGTSKVVALVGEYSPGNPIEVIGIGSHESRGLKRGVVVDIESTVQSIQRAIEEAELMAGCEIRSVYASISGNHVQCRNSQGIAPIRDGEVTYGDLDRVLEAAKAVAIPADQKILHAIPRDYVLDDSQEGIRNPVGMTGVRLEVHAHLVVCAQSAAANISKCVQRCGLQVDDLILSVLASSQAVLTSDERELGVVLVDIGAGTTDVAIFTNGAIRHTAVIPIAGDLITSDIAMALRTPTKDAEDIKVENGYAKQLLADPDTQVEVPGLGDRGPRMLSKQALAGVIEPRIEEIFSLVQQVVRESGYEEVLSSGVVLTGGSAVMPGMVELGEDIFLKPVRRGIPKYSSALSDMVAQPRAATVMGLLEEARFARMRGFKVAQKNGSVKTAFGRFKDFIVGNF